jgi:hypothetical protein
MSSMRNRLLAAPIAAILFSLVLITAFSVSTPSDGVFFLSVLAVALLLVAITVWSVLTTEDPGRSH